MAASNSKSTKKGRHFFSDKAAERKRKKKMQAYLHGDVKIPPSIHGRLSVQIGIISMILSVIILVNSYLTHGEAGAFIGALGLITVLLCCVGVFQGLVGLSEKDRDLGPCRRGVALNIILLIILILLFFGGLRS